MYAFEQIYLGYKTLDDIDWVRKTIEAKFTTTFMDQLKKTLSGLSDESSPKDIAAAVLKVFMK